MEKDSLVKPSVAELAGMFKGHALPMPTSNEQRKPVRRRPPCSLQLHKKQDDEESDKPTVVSPLNIKMKHTPFMEKLQANLALSPTSLLPSPKSPEVKLQPLPLSPTSPGSPLSPLSPSFSHTLRPSHQSSEEEEPIGFERPAEGTPLPNFNKSRARLSFKRRPPTRRHRRPTGEEAGASGASPSPCEPDGAAENGDEARVSDHPAQGPAHGQGSPPRSPATLKESGEDRATTEDMEPENAPTNRAVTASQEGQEVAQALEQGDVEEESQHMASYPTEAIGGSNSTGEGKVSQKALL